MKTNAIIRIVLLSLTIVILASILVVGILGNTIVINTDWGNVFEQELGDNSNLSSSGVADAGQIKRISIDWAAGSITIRPGDVEQITFREEDALSDKNRMIWAIADDKLVIQYAKSQTFIGITINEATSKDLTITVPRDWLAREIEIDAASAAVRIQDLTVEEIDFDGASGVLEIQNCSVSQLDVDTASGDIQFSGTLQYLDCDAVSADCDLNLQNTPASIDLDGVSGNLNLILPEETGFTVTLDTLSGKLYSTFLTTTSGNRHIYGDGQCRIDVSGVSGDVNIKTAQ